MANNVMPNSMGAPEPERILPVHEVGGKTIHTDKWRRCTGHVRNRKGGSAYNEYAVCTASIGYSGSFNNDHRMGARTPGGRAKRLKGQ